MLGDDSAVAEDLAETLREVLDYDDSQMMIEAELTRGQAKFLLERLEEIESELEGEHEVYSSRDIGEKTGADFERQFHLKNMMSPISDAIGNLSSALHEPWEMLVVINGQAFLLRAELANNYPETMWKATAVEIDTATLLHPSGYSMRDQVATSQGAHFSGEDALHEIISVIGRTVIDFECGQ